jgi:hypothetical protein
VDYKVAGGGSFSLQKNLTTDDTDDTDAELKRVHRVNDGASARDFVGAKEIGFA